MAKDPTCLVCQVAMEPGFLTDLGDLDRVNLPRWCAGKPERSRLGAEAKRSQKKAGLKVVAFRCPTCEALRLYAPSVES